MGVIMQIPLDKEFQLYKCMKVFTNTVQKVQQYNKDTNIVDIPEFCKMPEDRITTKADQYVTRLINENRLDDEFKKIINV